MNHTTTANTCSRRTRYDSFTPDLFLAPEASTLQAPVPPKLDVPVFGVRLVRERSHDDHPCPYTSRRRAAVL